MLKVMTLRFLMTQSCLMCQCHTGKDEGNMSVALALIIDGNSLVYILEKDLESKGGALLSCCTLAKGWNR
ncbi:unnamed protein product [Camellia sinensis]